MTWGKRIFDLACAFTLTLLIFPFFGWICLRIWWEGDGPIFYVSERMHAPNKPFGLIKFRTMSVAHDGDQGVTGGSKMQRITPLGAALRKRRFDELPQLWNIFKGDITVVGPRPPLREYVERYPDVYDQVLKSRPGVTGLASLIFHRREAELLENCVDPQETDEVYCRVCIPAKAKLDLMYQRNANLCLDTWILYRTLRQMLARKGPR
ncbi:sugar transferase [uncultured Litoreibacter sp.]|uniref:sugar transferase n=1 Tax=uncultured Litoreibacter sp. TaxID=1392394 RepID=UPI002608DD02|nr:sugar transferase [uncultured Litoreibacter sp.]